MQINQLILSNINNLAKMAVKGWLERCQC